MREFDVRFGIPIPANRLPGAAVKYKAIFSPLPQSVRKLRVRGLNGGVPATFQCDVIMGPSWGLPEETHKTIVKSKVFTIEFRGTGEALFSVDGPTIDTLSMSLYDWAQFYRLCAYIGDGGAIFEIEGNNQSEARQSFSITSPSNEMHRIRGEAFGAIVSQARSLLEDAGFEIETLTQADLEAAAPELAVCEARRTGPEDAPYTFDIDPAAAHMHSSPMETLFVIAVDLGAHRIACAFLVTFTGPGADGRTWTESASRMVRCSDIPQTEEGLIQFSEGVSKQMNIDIVMHASRIDTDDDFPEPSISRE